MRHDLTRRDFLKETALLATAAAALRTADGAAADNASAPGTKSAALPKIKLGSLEVSRLILGSNPFFGFAHQSGDIGRQMKEYYTDERIVEVLDRAADLGVTAVAAPVYDRWVKLYSRYLDKGGKLRIWIVQADGDPAKMKEELTRGIKAGAQAAFIQGHRAEDYHAAGKFDVVRGWVEHIKSLGVPAGLAAHRPNVHPDAEKQGFPTDFYFQCFYIPDTYRPEDRDKAVETIRGIQKPVIGYKILAAGRLKPEEGFAFALKHLAAKDGMCVGVFPKIKPDMLAEDVRLAK